MSCLYDNSSSNVTNINIKSWCQRVLDLLDLLFAELLGLTWNIWEMHLNITLMHPITLSSAFHHSSNPAERAVKTIKSLMKRCLAANTLWYIALLEYLSTPLSSNIPSPSELMGRQFRGLLPMFQDHSASEGIKEKVLLMKEAEKQRLDKMAHDLPVIPVSASELY